MQTVKLKIRQQQFEIIVQQIKEWYSDNQIQFQIGKGQLLLNIIRNACNTYLRQINQMDRQNKYLQTKLDQHNQLLIEYQKYTIELKHIIDAYQEDKKDINTKIESSNNTYQHQLIKLKAQIEDKEAVQKQNQELSIFILRKDKEIEQIRKITEKLKIQMKQINEKNQRLIAIVCQLKQQCRKYKLKEHLLNQKCLQLQEDLKIMTNIVDKNRTYNNYCTFIKSEESIQANGSEEEIYYQDNLAFLRQIQNQCQNYSQSKHIFIQKLSQQNSYTPKSISKKSTNKNYLMSMRQNKQNSLEINYGENLEKQKQYSRPKYYAVKSAVNSPNKQQISKIIHQNEQLLSLQQGLCSKIQFYEKIIKEKQIEITKIKTQNKQLLNNQHISYNNYKSQEQTQSYYCEESIEQHQINHYKKNRHLHTQSNLEQQTQPKLPKNNIPKILINQQIVFDSLREVQTQRVKQLLNIDIQLSINNKSALTDRSQMEFKRQQKEIQTLTEVSHQNGQSNYLNNYIPFNVSSVCNIGVQTDPYLYYKCIKMQEIKEVNVDVCNIEKISRQIVTTNVFESPEKYVVQKDDMLQSDDADEYMTKKVKEDVFDLSQTNDKSIKNSTDRGDDGFSFKKIKISNSSFQSIQQKDKFSNQRNINQNEIRIFQNINNIAFTGQTTDEKEDIVEIQQGQLDFVEPKMILNSLDNSDCEENKSFVFQREISFSSESQRQTVKSQLEENISFAQEKVKSQNESWTTIWQIMNIQTDANQSSFSNQKLPIIFFHKKVYMFEVQSQSNNLLKDSLIIWPKGIYSMKSKKYLKAKSKVIASIDRSMYILGNSELVLRGKDIWIRRKGRYSYLDGELDNANWKIISCRSYLII